MPLFISIDVTKAFVDTVCSKFLPKQDAVKQIRNRLDQGWATYGPRARSGPPSKDFWPAKCFLDKNLLI